MSPETSTASRHVDNRPQRPLVSTCLALVIALAISYAAIAPMANAAPGYTYSNSDAGKDQVRYSGPRSVVRGGEMRVHLGFAVTMRITTYYSKPGYFEVQSAKGSTPHSLYMSHSAKKNASSKCWWTSPKVSAGKAKTFCKASS